MDKSIADNISGDNPYTKINSDEDHGGQRGNEVLLVPVDTNIAPVESTKVIFNQETRERIW